MLYIFHFFYIISPLECSCNKQVSGYKYYMFNKNNRTEKRKLTSSMLWSNFNNDPTLVRFSNNHTKAKLIR